MFHHELKTEIEIAATPERVWSVLTDFPNYPAWNPFIKSVRGEPLPGSPLEVRVQPSGSKGMTFRPTIVASNPDKELRWLGRLFLPGLFDGEHHFAIEPLAGGNVRFLHGETFKGVLVPLFKAQLDRDTKRGFEEMNLALKDRAEGGGRSP